MTRRASIFKGEVDHKFSSEIAKKSIEIRLEMCLQCGVCAGSCPILFAMDYTPREIVELVKLGLRDRALTCKAIWLCSGCYACSDRCPENVNPAEIINSIRSIAYRSKVNTPTMFSKIVENILSYGWIYEVDELTNEERSDLGLPQLKTPNLKALKKMLEEHLLREG